MKYKRVAVHREDLDGISCAALVIRKAMLENEEPPEILFMSIHEVLEYPEELDLVADLPKPPTAKRVVDHHESNYERLVEEGRLGPEDLIDPKAPSAAVLLKSYLGLDGDKIAEEIVDMANITDTGRQTERTIPASKIISIYRRNSEVLLRLAQALAKYGYDYLKDDYIRKLREEIEKDWRERYEYLKEETRRLASRSKRLILDVIDVPNYARFDIPRLLFEHGAELVALLYTSDNGYRLSLRSSGPSVRHIAEYLGGGGHERSAGAFLGPKESTFYKAIGYIAKERKEALFAKITKKSSGDQTELQRTLGDMSVRYHILFVGPLTHFL